MGGICQEKCHSFFVGRDLKEKDLLHQCIVKFTIHGTENGRCYNK